MYETLASGVVLSVIIAAVMASAREPHPIATF